MQVVQLLQHLPGYHLEQLDRDQLVVELILDQAQRLTQRSEDHTQMLPSRAGDAECPWRTLTSSRPRVFLFVLVTWRSFCSPESPTALSSLSPVTVILIATYSEGFHRHWCKSCASWTVEHPPHPSLSVQHLPNAHEIEASELSMRCLLLLDGSIVLDIRSPDEWIRPSLLAQKR